MTIRTRAHLRILAASTLLATACMPGGAASEDPVTPARGGAPGSGGVVATGGAPATGGVPGTGGNLMAPSTGGAPGTGGSAPGSGGAGPAASDVAPGDDGGGAGSGMLMDPGSEGDGDSSMNGPYDPPPEATLGAGVTAGKLVDVPVVSKVFPGGNRTVQVYIPNGYVERTPAPFMVLQDGPAYVARFHLNTVLDNMIAKKQLPLMLAIFVPNGGGRRSVEYDTLSDAYVRFVLEDVLPAVEAGAPVKLTTDPEGRSAGGHSSGGIAAFTMGWHRPDMFRRILTHSGSFVSIRGGDKYPEIVKGMPKKPLRVFLSVGSKDNEPPRWQRGNETMAAALKQQGYHYRYVLQNGGTHAQTFPAAILPETLLWLWRGYPK